MPQCIYSLINDDDSKFSKQEHVFPACIGGIHKLPKGCVSDKINEMFSPLELIFARESPISISRMFTGPGKRGSLNPKKATSSKITVMTKSTDKKATLGFIKGGVPHVINQIRYSDNFDIPKQIHISLEPDYDKMTEEILSNFWKQLETYNNSPTVLKHSTLQGNEHIWGFYNNKSYLAIDKKCNGEEAKKSANAFVKILLDAKEKDKINMDNNFAYTQDQVEAHFEMAFSMPDYFRIVAKTAFNSLTYLKGSSFVLNKMFDTTRQAIYSGKDIEKYVKMTSDDKFLSQMLKSPHALQFGRNFHAVIISHFQSFLVAAVCFYGLKNPIFVVLTDKFEGQWRDPDGIVCDWEHKKEIDLIEFITKICGH